MEGNRLSSKNNKRRHEFGLGMWVYTINHRVMKVKLTLQSDVWLHLVQARWLSFKSEKECVSRSTVCNFSASHAIDRYSMHAHIQTDVWQLHIHHWCQHTWTHCSSPFICPPMFPPVICFMQTHSDTNQTGSRSGGSDHQQPLHELPIRSPRLPSQSGGGRPRLASLVCWLSGAVWGTPREPVCVLFGWPGAFM